MLLGRETEQPYDSVNAKWHDLRASSTKANNIFDNFKKYAKKKVVATISIFYRLHATNTKLPIMVNHSATKKRLKFVVTVKYVVDLDLNDEFDGTDGEGPLEVQLRRPPRRDKSRKAGSSSGKEICEDVLTEKTEKTLSFLEFLLINRGS